MVGALLVVLLIVVAANPEDSSEDAEDNARCVKAVKKFTITRICDLQPLAVECLKIETPYITEILDYCYKELNYDPILLEDTLQYVCSYEETIEKAADCLCRAVDLIEDSDISEEIEHEQSENEEFEPASYNSSMYHCFHYMDSIYRKYKRHFR